MDSRAVDRRKSFKTPPVAIDGGRHTQEQRRAQALEEQKRRRLLRVDSARQLDQFADLNLGLSDSDDENDDNAVEPEVLREGIAQFASLLPPVGTQLPPDSRTPSPAVSDDAQGQEPTNQGKGKGKGKKRRKGKRRRQSKWANKCMYAELLEMHDVEPVWSESAGWSTGINANVARDGLPEDLESGWVALAPVPTGKRCLAVTLQGVGTSGVVPNTTLRSRLLGKVILSPFPSPLPPNTILDCILDENWRSNGILHILDAIRWKGQDLSGCEAKFRFWWRDTRINELLCSPAPAPPPSSTSTDSRPTASATYRFPYPTTFLPVPYTNPTPNAILLNDVIPRARTERSIHTRVPDGANASATSITPAPSLGSMNADQEMEMEVDFLSPSSSSAASAWTKQVDAEVRIASDGILLYVAEATYESGESPLSVWVPRVPFEEPDYSHAHDDEKQGENKKGGDVASTESPLDVFERLVKRRLRLQGLEFEVHEVEMD